MSPKPIRFRIINYSSANNWTYDKEYIIKSKLIILILLQCIITLALLVIQDVYVLINYVSFVEAVFTTISVTGLLWMRYKKPDLNRPIKVSIVLPIVFFIICAFLVTFPCYVRPWEVGVGVVFILSGIPVYLITIGWKNKPRWLQNKSDQFNFLCAKLFVCMLENEYKNK